MKLILTTAILLSSSFWACNYAQQQRHTKEIVNEKNSSDDDDDEQKANAEIIFTKKANTIEGRIGTPEGFKRSTLLAGSLENYLRQLQLKKHGSLVKKYNGITKAAAGIYCAVVDKEIGTQDLHQCADATMYLWASYLFDTKQYEKIKFKFLGDDRWHFYKDYTRDYGNEKTFFKYMQEVWSAANTKSLYGSLKSISNDNVKVGDILIQTRNPYGHAVMIVDECVSKNTGKKLYLLAQSYMPAQETQILLNPKSENKSPWFDLSTDTINTPEWTFYKTDFKRF
jgi:hypothetical protein